MDLRPLKLAQEMLSAGSAPDRVIGELFEVYGTGYVDAVAAIAAARTLSRHGIAVRD